MGRSLVVGQLPRTLLFVAAFAASVGIAEPGERDAGACHYTTAMSQSWKDMWARQLSQIDPTHATKLIAVASEIIDGRLDVLRIDIASGLGPNTNLPSAGGDMSLLELAVAACRDEIARYLVSSGASANGDGSSTPLAIAAAKGEADLAEFLIQHGAQVDKIDLDGHTPLEEAVRQHSLNPVQVLLAHGADVNRRLARNATILDLVAYSHDPGDVAIANELRRHGAITGLTNR
jgi:hypothetical protein